MGWIRNYTVYYCVVCLPPLKSCWSAHVSLCSRVYHPLANITALVKVTMWFITNVKLSIILDCLLTTLPDSLSIGQPLQPSPEPFSACLQFSPCFGLIYRCHCPSPGILVIKATRHTINQILIENPFKNISVATFPLTQTASL